MENIWKQIEKTSGKKTYLKKEWEKIWKIWKNLKKTNIFPSRPGDHGCAGIGLDPWISCGLALSSEVFVGWEDVMAI